MVTKLSKKPFSAEAEQVIACTEGCVRYIILRHPLFAHLLLGSRVQAADHRKVATACTNGLGILYNPYFFLQGKLTRGNIEFVIMHEVVHMFLGHPRRFPVLRRAYYQVYDERFGGKAAEAGGPDYENQRDCALNQLMQEAGDYVVNLLLVEYFEDYKAHEGRPGEDLGLPVMPDDALLDDRFSGMALETVFDILFQEQKSKPNSSGGDGDPEDGDDSQEDGDDSQEDGDDSQEDGDDSQEVGPDSSEEGGSPGEGEGDPWGLGNVPDSQVCGTLGDVYDEAAEGFTGEDGEPEETEDWEARVVQALQSCRAQGFVPAGLTRQVLGAAQPRVRWKSKLLHFAKKLCKQDYNWMIRDRRMAHAGVIFPGLSSVNELRMVFAIDTSGSVGDHMLDRFFSELKKALKEVRWKEVTVIYVDADLTMQTFKKGRALDFKPTGGGGTDFRPPFKWVKDHYKGKPDCLIYFTDGMGTFPEVKPKYPVLWLASVSDVPYPEWAHVIHIPQCEM